MLDCLGWHGQNLASISSRAGPSVSTPRRNSLPPPSQPASQVEQQLSYANAKLASERTRANEAEKRLAEAHASLASERASLAGETVDTPQRHSAQRGAQRDISDASLSQVPGRSLHAATWRRIELDCGVESQVRKRNQRIRSGPWHKTCQATIWRAALNCHLDLLEMEQEVTAIRNVPAVAGHQEPQPPPSWH